jgi:hypothetical protein
MTAAGWTGDGVLGRNALVTAVPRRAGVLTGCGSDEPHSSLEGVQR